MADDAFSDEEKSLHERDGDTATFAEIRTDNRNFDYYERQFQEILLSLEGDDVLEAFRTEYAALHHSFLKSHDGETRLLRKCMELQSDLDSCAAKMQAADELTRGDKSTIESLKSEVSQTQRKTRAAHEREAVLKDKVSGLQRELRDMIARGASRPVEATAQEAALQALLRSHESVLKERESLEYQLSAARQDHAGCARRLHALDETRQQRAGELQVLRDAVLERQRAVEVQRAERAQLEEALRGVRADGARRAAAVQQSQQRLEQCARNGAAQQQQRRQLETESAELAEAFQTLSRQLQQVRRTGQDCNEENDALQRRMGELAEELREREAETEAATREKRRAQRLLEAAARRTAVLRGREDGATHARDERRASLLTRRAERDALTALVGKDEREVAARARERDALYGSSGPLQQQLAQCARQATFLAERRSEAHHLEHERRSYEAQGQKQNESIFSLSGECVGYEEQIKSAVVHAASVMAEVQNRELQIAEAAGEARDVEARLHQQQSLLDGMLSERNAYAKHYSSLRVEVNEMSRRFRLILTQIKQMQEEVVRRERALVAEEERINSLTRQRRGVEGQIGVLHQRTDRRTRGVAQFHLELRRLGDVLMEGEEEVGRQRRRVQNVQKERDLLGNQVVERGESLAQLYETVRVQAAFLRRGAELYETHTRTLAELERNAAHLRGEVAQMRQFAARIPELRRHIHTATRALGRERTRVRALMNECERPMNLHPNHQLAWADPNAHKLTQRIGELQRELVTRRAELDEKERRIGAHEQAYLQHKSTVARQPGPEMADQMALYQGNLAKKAGQMRAMMASLKYFREQTEIYQDRYDELKGALDQMAKSYAASRQRMEHIDGGGEYNGADAIAVDGKDETEEKEVMYVGYIAPPRDTGGEREEAENEAK